MSEHRPQRIARNEAVFRNVNEGIEKGHRDRPSGETISFVCECGQLGCNQLIALTVDQYEAVRAESHRFALVPGHELPEVETVVEQGDGYVVVEKHPETHEVVERTDPRSA